MRPLSFACTASIAGLVPAGRASPVGAPPERNGREQSLIGRWDTFVFIGSVLFVSNILGSIDRGRGEWRTRLLFVLLAYAVIDRASLRDGASLPAHHRCSRASYVRFRHSNKKKLASKKQRAVGGGSQFVGVHTGFCRGYFFIIIEKNAHNVSRGIRYQGSVSVEVGFKPDQETLRPNTPSRLSHMRRGALCFFFCRKGVRSKSNSPFLFPRCLQPDDRSYFLLTLRSKQRLGICDQDVRFGSTGFTSVTWRPTSLLQEAGVVEHELAAPPQDGR